MGTFHMVQNTVAGYLPKRQSTVETATYVTEFIAGRTCLDEAIALRYELRMLGAPLEGPIWMFGDNKSMIKSSAEPSGRLAKRHLILSWHHLREKAAMKIVYYLHVSSKENISDCLKKHLVHPQLWALIKEHLFYQWNENGKVESFFLSLTDDSAPDGECQAGFSIGLEQAVLANDEAVPVFDDSWHRVFYNDQWYLMPLEAYHTWIVMPEGIHPWINTHDVHVDGHVG
jgi:hypothetical protein